MDKNKKFEELAIKFEGIEKNKKQGDKPTLFWVKDITDPQYQLISRLIIKLSDKLLTKDTKEKIFTILQLCLEMNRESVLPELKSSKQFPNHLVNFIIENDNDKYKKKLLYIFAFTFDLQVYQPLINEKLIAAIFNTVKSLDDEEIFERIIYILIDINSIYTSNDDNKFLDVYHVNENNRVLDEVLLRILNNEEDKERLLKILLCFNNIMDKEKRNVFYSKDLETFIDIVLLKLETTYTDGVKLFLLEALKRVTYYNDLYKEMYKVKALTDLVEDFSSNDEQSEAVKKISKKILSNIQRNLAKKLKAECGVHVEDEGEEEEDEEGEDEEGEEEEDEAEEGENEHDKQ